MCLELDAERYDKLPWIGSELIDITVSPPVPKIRAADRNTSLLTSSDPTNNRLDL